MVFLKVYGVISKILEPGTFTMCTPVFVDPYERGKYTKFYRPDDKGQVTEFDLAQYGKPIFLPASKKKINDGKEYFIIYRSTQNATQKRYVTYTLHSIAICPGEEASWMAKSLSMGIKFPDKFVCVLAANIDKERLENMI